MIIYCELFIDKVRLKIDDDEIAFQVGQGYYEKKMFHDSLTSNRIKGYVLMHKNELPFFSKMKYNFTGNKVYVLVNQEVQEVVSIKQINDFASIFLDGGLIKIIPKPVTFDSAVIEDIRRIRTEYLKGPRHTDRVMAQARAAMAPSPRMAGRTR